MAWRRCVLIRTAAFCVLRYIYGSGYMTYVDFFRIMLIETFQTFQIQQYDQEISAGFFSAFSADGLQ